MNQLIMAVLLSGVGLGIPNARLDSTVNQTAAFAKLKTLAGEWEAQAGADKAHLSISVIAGGTAIIEHETHSKMPSMMTVYHLDGSRLVLTHYCMAGNQPRMRATAYRPDSGEMEFRFLDATNLSSSGAGHMHAVKIRFLDHKHFQSEWTFHENGQSKMTEVVKYVRVG